MHVKQIHSFNLNREEFVKTQQSLIHKINLSPSIHLDSINTCAGVDLAYWEQDGEPYGVCCIIVIDADTKEIIEKVHSMGRISVPYVSGFLAFRELPLIIEAAKKLETEPDVFLFDGNGYLHYNHMGVATHAAFFWVSRRLGLRKPISKSKAAISLCLKMKYAYTPIFSLTARYMDGRCERGGMLSLFSCLAEITLI